MLDTHHSFHPAPTFWPVTFKLSYPLRRLIEVVLRTSLLLVYLQQTSTKIMRAHTHICTHNHLYAPTTTAATATNTTQCALQMTSTINVISTCSSLWKDSCTGVQPFTQFCP